MRPTETPRDPRPLGQAAAFILSRGEASPVCLNPPRPGGYHPAAVPGSPCRGPARGCSRAAHVLLCLAICAPVLAPQASQSRCRDRFCPVAVDLPCLGGPLEWTVHPLVHVVLLPRSSS